MDGAWKATGMACFLAWAVFAAGQTISPPAPEGKSSLLTLSFPTLRSAMDRANLPTTLLEQVPDFRLKLDRSGEMPGNPFHWDERLRGVEIRLPMSPLWLGYNLPAEGGDSQATFSIQMGF